MKQQLDICPRLQIRQPIYLDEIAWLEGMDNYTMVYFMSGQKVLASKTLQTFDNLLPPNDFLRLNRQIVVRISSIVAWRMHNRILTIILRNNLAYTVSRRKVLKVKNCLIQAFDKQLWQNKYSVAQAN